MASQCRCSGGGAWWWCPGPSADRAGRAPDLAALARQPLISYESSTRPNSSLQRAFAANGLVPDLALTALDVT